MAKRFLDKLRWHPQRTLRGVEIIYLHRGAPMNRLSVRGEEILAFEKSFFVIKRENMETRIPYHRILEIKRGEELLWRKR